MTSQSKQAGAFIFRRMLANTTISFSNLVGPTEKIELCGHPVVFIAPSVYGVPQVSHPRSYVEKPSILNQKFTFIKLNSSTKQSNNARTLVVMLRFGIESHSNWSKLSKSLTWSTLVYWEKKENTELQQYTCFTTWSYSYIQNYRCIKEKLNVYN